MEYKPMTESQIRSLIHGIRVSHTPKIPELDQNGGLNNLICTGHGMGYPPPYPCQTMILTNELEIRLNAYEDTNPRTVVVAETFDFVKPLPDETLRRIIRND